MAEINYTDIPFVDERTKLQQKGTIPTPVTSKPKTAIDPYYAKNPITGLSPAQKEARAAQAAAKTIAKETASQLGLTVNAKTGMINQPASNAVFNPATGKFTVPASTIVTSPSNVNVTKSVVSTYTDPTTGDVIAVWSDGSKTVLAKGGNQEKASNSAWNLLKGYFDSYGLGMLVDDVKGYIESGLSYDELLLKLRTESKAYKKRFAANTGRISKGLRALSEAEYIKLEDDYQDIMRRYGMPESYYSETVDPETGVKVQKGFEKFIEGDVSPVELEDRVQTAYNRVLKANPEVMNTLKQYYGDSITNGDVLAYALDTKNAIEEIKRKVTAAEIGGAASQFGLGADRARAEELRSYGVTGAQAREGFQTVAAVTPRAGMLADIYSKQGLGPYTQTTAEAEVFGTPGSVEAAQKRRKLTELEQAQFAGSSGAAGGALSRERAGSF